MRLPHRRLAAALALFASLASPAARAEPALWRVRGSAGTIYLFGTMHILPRPADWLVGHVADAFHASTTLWEEADVSNSDQGKLNQLMARGMDPTGNLWSKLPPETVKKFRAQLQRCHLSPDIVGHFRPWLATIMPTICELMAQSQQPGAPPKADDSTNPENVLTHEAKVTGKTVAYFETAEEQIGYLSASPEAAQLAQLRRAIDGVANGEDDFAALEDQWLRGDIDAIAKQAARMREEGEDFYRTILVDRNIRFAARIKTLAAQPGTHFVALGAAHFAGPDSVQTELKRLGLTAERLN